MDSPAAIRPTVCEIDLHALCANARLISQAAGAPIVAVVKADAYGHGALAVARTLARQPEVCGFAVNMIEEAIGLRDGGIDDFVLVMGPTLAGGYDDIVGHHLTPMLSCIADIDGVHEAAARRGCQVPVHLYIDTGMGRLGFAPADAEALADRLAARPNLRVTGLGTHMACADIDDPHDPDCMTHRQLARFADARMSFTRALRAAGVLAAGQACVHHLANSATALRFPGVGGDFVRVGLALYGNGAGPRDPTLGALRPVMRLSTRVAQIRTVAVGESVSYGALFRATRTTTVAVLPLGYADGVPRRATGRAEVLIHGRRCPVIGAITMGIIMADITDMPAPVRVGDPVVIFGERDGARISVAEFAGWAGRIEYEVTCSVSARVPRVYVGQA